MISVIIPTCNRNELLGKCLDKLAPSMQSLSQDAYEVIVTDDSVNKSTYDFIQKNYQWVQCVEGPKKGPAANRNNGAIYAKGEWLVFIDDDCLPDENLLKEYIKAINENPTYMAFEGSIIPDDWNLLKKDLSECPINITGGYFWSANICVKETLFKDIKGFNENYLIAAQEDQQLKMDIEILFEQKILFLKNCIVIHPVRISSVYKKIKFMPVASKNFVKYAYINRKTLNYKSVYLFSMHQFKYLMRNMYNCLKAAKFKDSFVAFVWLVYGLPLNIKNYYKQLHK